MMPSCDQTGVPIHFHSSTTSGSASLMSLRILLRVSPRQSPSSAILFEMSSDADWPWLPPDFFIVLILEVPDLSTLLRPTGGREQVGGCDCLASTGRPRREFRRPTESPHALCLRSANEWPPRRRDSRSLGLRRGQTFAGQGRAAPRRIPQ